MVGNSAVIQKETAIKMDSLKKISVILIFGGTSALETSCTTKNENDTIFACGVVLDASTKNPVLQAMVSLSTCGRGAVPNTDEIDYTDSKGNFEVQAAPCNSRDYTLYISASGYKDKSVKGLDNGDFIFDTCSSNEILLEIQK